MAEVFGDLHHLNMLHFEFGSDELPTELEIEDAQFFPPGNNGNPNSTVVEIFEDAALLHRSTLRPTDVQRARYNRESQRTLGQPSHTSRKIAFSYFYRMKFKLLAF